METNKTNECPQAWTSECNGDRCTIWGTKHCIEGIPVNGKCSNAKTSRCDNGKCALFGTPRCVDGVIKDPLSGKMKVGYYVLSPGFHHTYAKMTFNNKTISFPCYGGTDDPQNTFPAEFFILENYSTKKKLGKELDCNHLIARRLATWTNDVDPNRTNYNRKSGGWRNLGDSSGLIYAVTGVCHQMCNTIASSTNTSNVRKAGGNWPRDLYGSSLLYGFRGHTISQIEEMIALWNTFDTAYTFKEEKPTASALSAFNQKTDQLDNVMFETLKSNLQMSYDSNALANLITDNLAAPDMLEYLKKQPYYNDICKKYASIRNKKKDLDNSILREQISKPDYAKEVNALITIAADEYAKVATANDFKKAFDINPGEKLPAVVDVKLMPESYAGIRKTLGL
ncbi:MAG: hypothetical protein LBC85_10440 [Fibromonadaceae bacterium]|jgi:hypothetical protein|nr:hypothetical protein [Fibromonadaceae bacterium]